MEGEDQRKSQRLAKCKHTKRRRRREKWPWRRKRRERRQLIRTLRVSKIGFNLYSFLQMQDNLQQQGGNKQRKKGWHGLQIWWGWDSWAPWTVLRLLSGSFLTARKANSVRAPIVTGTWRLIISAIWSADLLRWKAKTLGAPCTVYNPWSPLSTLSHSSGISQTSKLIWIYPYRALPIRGTWELFLQLFLVEHHHCLTS